MSNAGVIPILCQIERRIERVESFCAYEGMSPLLIALTGGIATGKSTVSRWLAGQGWKTIDADAISRELLSPGGLAEPAVLKEWGTTDRSELRHRMFQNPQERKKLETILHPLIQAESQKRIEEALRSRGPGVIYEAPVLIEAGRAQEFKNILLITANETVRIERLKKERNLSEAEAKKIIASQLPDSEKSKFARWMIDNSGTPAELHAKLKEWLKTLGIALFLWLPLTGCNLYSPFASPQSTESILARARGCLNGRDFACARREYSKFSNGDTAELALSESALTDLEEAGVGGQVVFTAFQAGTGAGDRITSLVLLAPTSIKNSTSRTLILQALQKAAQIQSNIPLRGLVRFIAGYSLAAAVLSEERQGSSLSLLPASQRSSCLPTGCASNAQCASSVQMITAGTTLDLSGSLTSISPYELTSGTWGLFQAGLSIARTGLSEMAASGSLVEGAQDLSVAFSTISVESAGSDRCFRAEILRQKIGEYQ
jgi:dephospho-CoA kinase